MPIKLVCVHEFHGYKRGDVVLDPDLVAEFLNDKEMHFVKVEFTEDDHEQLKAMRDKAKEESDAALERATKAQQSHAKR